MEQPGKVANPVLRHRNREHIQIFPLPRPRLRVWSRETGSTVMSSVSVLISALITNLVLYHGISSAFGDGVYLSIPSTAIRLVPSLLGHANTFR